MSIQLKFVLAIAVTSLTGCSTVYEGKYDFRDDWRKARVMDVVGYSAKTQKKDPYCSNGAAPSGQSDQVALLSYRQFNRSRTTIRPLLKDTKLLPGAVVYVNLSHCDWPVVPAQ